MVTKKVSAATEEIVTVALPRLDLRQVTIEIVGTSQLVVHRFGQKAIRGLGGLGEGGQPTPPKGRTVKTLRTPQEDFQQSQHYLPDGRSAFPAVAFKAAAVRAASYYPRSVIDMTKARGLFRVLGELIPIQGEPTMREDWVRNKTGVPDLRYRASFFPWTAELEVRYLASHIDLRSLLTLFQIAGTSVGVGEWRPEKGGTWGCFDIRVE